MNVTTINRAGAALATFALVGSLANAQRVQSVDGFKEKNFYFEELPDGTVLTQDVKGTYWFKNYAEYSQSGFFQEHGLRCAAAQLPSSENRGSTSDCSASSTNPAAEYAPAGGTVHRIPVVFHILMSTGGSGNVTDAACASQIDVLNEDYRAIPGTNGAPGVDTSIEFFLATEDPSGNPTTGITRTTNNSWYNDSGNYASSLNWDSTEYLNIYTNTAGGYLGYTYVPNGGGVVGNSNYDYVVLLWSAVGKNAPIGAPYNQGRTATHEVGHYLGLYHTFDGGCDSGSCYSDGDLICDTNDESSAFFGCGNRTTCGSSDPTTNYMDYTDDLCMYMFTEEQARRMRCTIDNFRFDLPSTGGGDPPPGAASGPNPSNGATNVATSGNVSWSSGSNTDSFDVYFGTDSTPDAGEYQGNQAGTSFSAGTLAEGTTYYWRVDAVNAVGTTTGNVWSFTTLTSGGSSIDLSLYGYLRGRRDKWTVELTWSGASGSNIEIYRNGSFLRTTRNDGYYRDRTGFTGSGSLTYQVCEIGGSVCSAVETVNF